MQDLMADTCNTSRLDETLKKAAPKVVSLQYYLLSRHRRRMVIIMTAIETGAVVWA